jgi:PAS domain S-box-containing protein
MADRIPGVVWATDTELRFTASFGAGLAALGLRPSEVIGSTIGEYFQTDDKTAPIIVAHRRALQGEMVEGEQIWQDRRYRFRLEQLRDEAGAVIGCIGFAQDITEQTSAENALRASEERFRRIFDEGPLGVVLVDLEVRIQRVNARFCAMLGYTEGEIVALGLRGLTHPEDWEKDRQLGAGLRRGEIHDYCIEKRYLRKDGTVMCGHLTVSMMRDAAGKPTAIIGLVEDVTERKRAERSLRESERRLATLMGNLPGAVYRCRADADWTIEFLSDGYRALTGYSPDEFVGTPGTRYSELIQPDDQQREFHAMQAAIAERRQYQVEYRLRTASGEERWCWEQGIGIFSQDGELEAIEGFTTDITPRKRTEKELRVSEAKYRRLYQSMRDAFVSVDMSGRIIEFNDAYCQMLGYAPDELLELTYVDITPPKWHALEAEIVEKQILQRRYSDTYEKEYRRRDGTVFPVELRTFLVMDDDDQPSSMWAIVRDITKRKAAQAALVRSRDELERRVEERTAELVEANRLLKAEILERQRAEGQLRQERNALHRTLQASDRDRELITYEIHDGVAQRLLGALMQFEACERGARYESEAVKAMFEAGLQGLRDASAEARSLMNRTRTPVLEKFGVQAAIADFIDQLSDRPDAPEIMYRCDVKFHRLESDIENAIFRVAQEAITNACRHSRSDVVRVSLVQAGQEVTLEVEDRGIGFDVAEVAEGRFGLDGIRERARAFGTHFQLDSTPGQGTRIRVTFPVIEIDLRHARPFRSRILRKFSYDFSATLDSIQQLGQGDQRLPGLLDTAQFLNQLFRLLQGGDRNQVASRCSGCGRSCDSGFASALLPALLVGNFDLILGLADLVRGDADSLGSQLVSNVFGHRLRLGGEGVSDALSFALGAFNIGYILLCHEIILL